MARRAPAAYAAGMAEQGIAAVLLAAGRGRRFGADKLAAAWQGRPLAHHAAATLAALPVAWRLAVVGPGGAAPPGWAAAVNPEPDRGMGGSVAAGVRAARARGAGLALVALADMPLVSAGHLGRLLARAAGPGTLVASTDGARRLPPALFGANWFDALAALTGDQGARDLLARAELVAAPPGELADVDRPADLAALDEAAGESG